MVAMHLIKQIWHTPRMSNLIGSISGLGVKYLHEFLSYSMLGAGAPPPNFNFLSPMDHGP